MNTTGMTEMGDPNNNLPTKRGFFERFRSRNTSNKNTKSKNQIMNQILSNALRSNTRKHNMNSEKKYGSNLLKAKKNLGPSILNTMFIEEKNPMFKSKGQKAFDKVSQDDPLKILIEMNKLDKNSDEFAKMKKKLKKVTYALIYWLISENPDMDPISLSKTGSQQFIEYWTRFLEENEKENILNLYKSVIPQDGSEIYSEMQLYLNQENNSIKSRRNTRRRRSTRKNY
jgi:hypothetical protein